MSVHSARFLVRCLRCPSFTSNSQSKSRMSSPDQRSPSRYGVFMATRYDPTIRPKQNLASLKREKAQREKLGKEHQHTKREPAPRSAGSGSRRSPPNRSAALQFDDVRREVGKLSYASLPSREKLKLGADAVQLGNVNESVDEASMPPGLRVGRAVSRAKSPIRVPTTVGAVTPRGLRDQQPAQPWQPPDRRQVSVQEVPTL